jgi:septum site-determining protein MinD
MMTIHSYRGGTGKTLLSTNLAASYSKKEKVCLLDYDFRAPCLNNMFDVPMPDLWLNDFLNGDCEIKEVLSEVYPNLYIGLANPEAEAVREMMGKSRSWETEALSKTLVLKNTLADMGFDRVIFDTSPGLVYSSINAVVASDVVALVMRLGVLDILGTKEMVKGVYELLEKPTFIVVNMVVPPQQEVFGPTLKKTFGLDTLGYLPCLCEVRALIAEGKEILIDEGLEYSKAVLKLSHDIDNFCKR